MGKKKTGAAGGLVERIAELDRQIEVSKAAQRVWLGEEKSELKKAATALKAVKNRRAAMRVDMLALVEQRRELAAQLEAQARPGKKAAAVEPEAAEVEAA